MISSPWTSGSRSRRFRHSPSASPVSAQKSLANEKKRRKFYAGDPGDDKYGGFNFVGIRQEGENEDRSFKVSLSILPNSEKINRVLIRMVTKFTEK